MLRRADKFESARLLGQDNENAGMDNPDHQSSVGNAFPKGKATRRRAIVAVIVAVWRKT
jgi:hypothetical protein